MNLEFKNEMKETIKQIKPRIGLGSLKFGMLQEEVKSLLGLPNEIEIYKYTSDLSDCSENWYFEDLELSLSFSSEDDWKLDTISINSAYYSLWGSIEIGQSITNTQEILKGRGITDYNYEDWSNIESPDHKLIEVTDSDVNLWFDNGELSEIQWSPKFEDENTIEWPFNSELKGKQTELAIQRYSTDSLFSKLDKHLDEFLNKIFTEREEYENLVNDFPKFTQRENLKTENRSIRYFLDTEDRVDGSVIAKARLIHSEIGDIGWMAVEWKNDLTILDDFLVVETE